MESTTSVPLLTFAHKNNRPLQVPMQENLWTPMERGSYATSAVFTNFKTLFPLVSMDYPQLVHFKSLWLDFGATS